MRKRTTFYWYCPFNLQTKELAKNRPLNNVFFNMLEVTCHKQLMDNKVKKYADDDVTVAMFDRCNRGDVSFEELADFLR